MLTSPVDAASAPGERQSVGRAAAEKNRPEKLKKKHTSPIADFKKRHGHFGARTSACFQMTVVFA
jgi:hypothetical protein